MNCPKCGSSNIKKNGISSYMGKIYGQKIYCKSCRNYSTIPENYNAINEEDCVSKDNILEELDAEIPFQRVGCIDIETTGLWGDFGYVLVAVIRDITSGSKNGKVETFRLDETESYKNVKNLSDPAFWKRIDRELLIQISEAISKYDIIVHFNGRNFDWKFLDTRLIKNRLDLLPTTKQIDIFQIAKYKLRLRSKKLDALREFLEVDEESTGHLWEYWQMAAARIKEGYDFVVDHCQRDVDRLAAVAIRMKPFIDYIKK